MGQRFRNPITVQGVESEDSRLFVEFTWRDLPLSFRWVQQDTGGHRNAQAVGVLETISEATPDDLAQFAPDLPTGGVLLMGEGEYADGVAAAGEAAALAAMGAQFISADPGGIVEYHWEILDQDGNTVDPVDIDIAYEKVYYGSPDAADLREWLGTLRERTVFDQYQIGAITQVDTPCWPQCRLALTNPAAPGMPVPPAGQQGLDARDHTDPAVAKARQVLRLLAAGPVQRPAGWYQKQTLDRYTPLTVTDDGQLIGHLAPWNACHRGFTSKCVMVPYQTEFPDFHVGGEVALDDGTRMKIGVLTHFGGHFGSIADYTRAAEDPQAQLGSVRLYADRWGIQACGGVHPDVPAAQVNRAMASQPSGDWRLKNGKYTLHAAALVNSPGYVGYQEEADGVVQRMVAAIPPPPLGDGTQVPVDRLFFEAPPQVLADAACPCQSAYAPEPVAPAGASGQQAAEPCGCGAHEGPCTCEHGLTARDLADLADLDAAVATRRRTEAAVRG